MWRSGGSRSSLENRLSTLILDALSAIPSASASVIKVRATTPQPKQKGKNQMSSDQTEVGYGRPPRHSRFNKGQSGIPKGRAKGTNNLKTDLTEELEEMILVREGTQTIKISKQRAILKTLIARTLKGDGRAAS